MNITFASGGPSPGTALIADRCNRHAVHVRTSSAICWSNSATLNGLFPASYDTSLCIIPSSSDNGACRSCPGTTPFCSCSGSAPLYSGASMLWNTGREEELRPGSTLDAGSDCECRRRRGTERVDQRFISRCCRKTRRTLAIRNAATKTPIGEPRNNCRSTSVSTAMTTPTTSAIFRALLISVASTLNPAEDVRALLPQVALHAPGQGCSCRYPDG